MTRSILVATLAGVAIMLSALTPAQAAMVGVPGATVPSLDLRNGLVQKTQRRARRGDFRRVARRGPRGRRGRRGRGVAIGAGVALGVLGAIAASEAYARERRHERRCRCWRRQCYNGSDRACWKFDDRC